MAMRWAGFGNSKHYSVFSVCGSSYGVQMGLARLTGSYDLQQGTPTLNCQSLVHFEAGLVLSPEDLEDRRTLAWTGLRCAEPFDPDTS